MIKQSFKKIVGIFGILSAIYLTAPKKTEAVPLYGFFIDTPDCSLKVYRKPTGSIDTLWTKTNFDGKFAVETANFVPPAQIGETLCVYGGWNLGGEAKTFDILTPSPASFLDLNLNKHTVCIENVYDSSHVNAPLKAIYFLQGVAPETTEVDTGYNQGFTFYYDIHVPFDSLEATQGKPGMIRLEKVLGDTTWYRNIPFTVSRERFDAQLVKDTVYFTRDSFSVFKDIGIEQILVPDSADSGQMIVPGIVIRNYGTINQEPYLHCKINEFYNDSMQVTMPPGIDTFYFSPCSLNSVGNFLVTQYSVLQGDVNPSNDTLRKTIVVNSVSVVEENLENKVRERLIIKPNPAKNYLISSKEAILYDALGRKVKKIDEGKNNINLNSGVYFIKKDDDVEKLVIYK